MPYTAANLRVAAGTSLSIILLITLCNAVELWHSNLQVRIRDHFRDIDSWSMINKFEAILYTNSSVRSLSYAETRGELWFANVYYGLWIVSPFQFATHQCRNIYPPIVLPGTWILNFRHDSNSNLSRTMPRGATKRETELVGPTWIQSSTVRILYDP